MSEEKNMPLSMSYALYTGLLTDWDSFSKLVAIWNKYKWFAPVQLHVRKDILDKLVKKGVYEKKQVHIYCERSIRRSCSANIYRRIDGGHVYIRPFNESMFNRWNFNILYAHQTPEKVNSSPS